MTARPVHAARVYHSDEVTTTVGEFVTSMHHSRGTRAACVFPKRYDRHFDIRAACRFALPRDKIRCKSAQQCDGWACSNARQTLRHFSQLCSSCRAQAALLRRSERSHDDASSCGGASPSRRLIPIASAACLCLVLWRNPPKGGDS